MPDPHDRRVRVAPSATEPGCYEWTIHAPDGRRLARAPYASATEEAARLSAGCWRQELDEGPAPPPALRVLIVDDNVFYAEALHRLLERARHAVVGIVDHAEAALRLARAERPDLALVDLMLRDGCSGPELGCRLAEAGVGVLFVTATPGLAPGLAPEGGRGLLGVLPKPAGDARLLRAVAAAGARIGRRAGGA